MSHALSVSSLDSGTDHSVGSVSTASVSADQGALLVLWIALSVSGGSSVAGVSGITGLTWSQQAVQGDGGSVASIECWTASVPAGGVSGSATASFSGGVDACNYDLDVVAHAAYFTPLVGSNVQKNFGNAGPSSSLTFNAPADSANLFLFGCEIQVNTGQSADETVPWTVLASPHQGVVRNLGLATQVSPDVSATSASSTWTSGGSQRWAAIGLELVAC